MSTSKNNLFQKTSFLAGNNTDYIEEYYSQYLQDPNSLPESWRSTRDVRMLRSINGVPTR